MQNPHRCGIFSQVGENDLTEHETMNTLVQEVISSPPFLSGLQPVNEPFFDNTSKSQHKTTNQEYVVTLSREGKEQSANTTDTESSSTRDLEQPSTPEKADENEDQLTAQQQQEVAKLKKRDAEVKAHEQAHLATAGQYAAGGASFAYQTGPDGRRYAVGGEVPIDISKESTPEATIQKMQIVARAALAPANPSPADRNIAARAAMIQSQARGELQQQKMESDDTVSSSPHLENSESPDNSSEEVSIRRTDPTADFENSGISINSRQMIVNTYRANQI